MCRGPTALDLTRTELLMRSSTSIAWAVWKALFLREAVARLSSGRAAWVWILAEPVVHLVFLNVLFGFALRQVATGIDGGLFITTGVLGFMIARNSSTRPKDAISANVKLLTYRQVLPIDTVLVRAALEAVLFIVSALFLLSGLGLVAYGDRVIPHDCLLVLLGFSSLWAAGTGLGLLFSVISELFPQAQKIVDMLFRPLYFVSGVMYPASAIPPVYQSWFLLNPLAHGIETIRTGFFPQYHTVSGVSLGYLWGFALFTIGIGLALHVRFATRLVTQ